MKAFNPMPGARANGRLAISAMISVAMADEIAVAEKTLENCIPVSLRIPGFTARI